MVYLNWLELSWDVSQVVRRPGWIGSKDWDEYLAVRLELDPHRHPDVDVPGWATDHVGREPEPLLLHQLDNRDVVGNRHRWIERLSVGGVREDRPLPARVLIRRGTAALGTHVRQGEDPAPARLAPGDPEHTRRAAGPERSVEIVEGRCDARRDVAHAPIVGFAV